MEMTGAKILLECLLEQGVDTIFGYPGGAVLEIYDALKEKGYNPINQLVGYILSEDPTYITTHNNARNLIRRIDRDTLLQSLVKYYLSN